MKKLFAWLLAGAACLNLALAQTTSPVQLGHGLNLGNFLEAPHEGDWSNGRMLTEGNFSIIHQAGFTLVRVPIRWSGHVGPAPDYTIDPAFLNRIDWVVAQAHKNNLQVILDYHHDEALMKDPDANSDRFVATWKQIADHFHNEPSTVVFELLNEPGEKLNDPVRWNALIARGLKVIRATNPDRSVVIGAARWNAASRLKDLVLPEDDRNLIITFHYYNPMKFTHQGASWVNGSAPWLGTTWEGTDAEKLKATQDFDMASDWGKAHRRPIYLGEFGSYKTADIDSRVRWTTFMARNAEAHDFSWTYWEFCSGFGVYDPQANQWRQPLLNALLPKP